MYAIVDIDDEVISIHPTKTVAHIKLADISEL